MSREEQDAVYNFVGFCSACAVLLFIIISPTFMVL
jgi:hypothetical protein